MGYKSERLIAKEYVELCLGSVDVVADDNPASGMQDFISNMDEQSIGEELKIKGPEEGQEMSLYLFRPSEPSEEKMACIYYCHGGGYLEGNALLEGDDCKAMADLHNALVVSPEYRMPKDAPFPAPLEDAYAGLAYVYDHADELNIDKDKIMLSGECAGCGLTAGLALYTKDKGRIPLKGEVLLFPYLDCRTCSEEDIYKNEYAGEFVWPRELVALGWKTYKGDKEIPADMMRYFSPSMATIEQAEGLPPTFITVGGLDVFVNECLDYANKLSRAGVSVELHLIPGVPHAFDAFPTPQAEQFSMLRTEAINRMLWG